MFGRSIFGATLLLTTSLAGHADEIDKTPCWTTAAYLAKYAKAHPGKAVDTGEFEFLNNAAHIADDGSDSGTLVSGIAAHWFETVAAALASLRDVEIDQTASDFLSASAIEEDDGSYTVVRDLRPYSNHVIISQTQGTAHCDAAAIFRVENGALAPSSLASSDDDICDEASLIAVRVQKAAYPAILETYGDGQYTVYILPPDETVLSRNRALCAVKVSFAPKTVITRWDARGATATSPSASKLRSILEPILVSHDASDRLKALEPSPIGNSRYDNFLRAADRHSFGALQAMDPQGRLIDGSYNNFSAFLPGIGFYPIAIDGHELILVQGEPTVGYRLIDESAIGVWEWTGKDLVPLVSGSLGIRGSHPKITVE